MNQVPLGNPGMGQAPNFNLEFQRIGLEFVNQFYSMYDNIGKKSELVNFYADYALLTFEGDQQQGREAIMKKHMVIRSESKVTVTRGEVLSFLPCLSSWPPPPFASVAIGTKSRAVTCQTAHVVTRADCQPTADGGVLVVVLGQLKTEGEERPLGFSHTFFLKDVGGGSFAITNEIFQLALHNF